MDGVDSACVYHDDTPWQERSIPRRFLLYSHVDDDVDGAGASAILVHGRGRMDELHTK